MGDPLQALAHLPVYPTFRRWYAGDPAVSSIAEFTGLKLVGTEPGKAVITFRPDTRHANAGEMLQGGMLTVVGDAALGTALVSTLAEDEIMTTVELKVNFLRPARDQTLRFEGRVVHRGSRLALVECDVTDEQGKLVARLNSTFMILPGKPA